jgi:hypothetical protein
MEQTKNPYEGIVYSPASNTFSVSVGRRFIGHFDSLSEAMQARRDALRKLAA